MNLSSLKPKFHELAEAEASMIVEFIRCNRVARFPIEGHYKVSTYEAGCDTDTEPQSNEVIPQDPNLSLPFDNV